LGPRHHDAAAGRGSAGYRRESDLQAALVNPVESLRYE